MQVDTTEATPAKSRSGAKGRYPLAAIRQARGMRQLDVAAAAGVCMETVRKIERGEVDLMAIRTLVQVANALSVTAVDLVPALGVRSRKARLIPLKE